MRAIRYGLGFAAMALAASPSAADTSFQVIARFTAFAGGTQPEAGVIVDPADGRSLFGTTASGGAGRRGTIFKVSPPAAAGDRWAKRILYDFPSAIGGAYPLDLVPDGNGGLFGYSFDGGTAGYGTVFQVTPRANPAVKWTGAQLHSFQFGADGAHPTGIVLRGRSLFGVTVQGGGAGSCRSPDGELIYCGAVVQIAPPASAGGTWRERVIYVFTGGDDGATPSGRLHLLGKTIIGTTSRGGSGACFENGVRTGCGVVYQLVPSEAPGGAWTQQVLFAFPGGVDGASPLDGVISDGAGGLFGITGGGGNPGFGGAGLGTVYHLIPTNSGWGHSVIYRFAGGTDGEQPLAGLLYNRAKKVLYGTTALGGTSSFAGTAFQLAQQLDGSWSKTILHNFNGRDGANPTSALVADSAGALYGTTVRGDNGGTLFRISLSP